MQSSNIRARPYVDIAVATQIGRDNWYQTVKGFVWRINEELSESRTKTPWQNSFADIRGWIHSAKNAEILMSLNAFNVPRFG